MRSDLHTHCGEGINRDKPTEQTVRDIVAAARARGLDAIGITEHYNKAWGFDVKQMVEGRFGGELLVIPGQEVDKGRLHVVELYLPGGLTFRFVAHPGHPRVDFGSLIDDSIHGIELRNPIHDWEMDETIIRRVAEEHDLLLLQNSDAHYLSDIGRHCNEITIEELCERARRGRRGLQEAA